MMKKTVAAASPDDYVAALDGWRKKLVESLRRAILSAKELEEAIKWRNLVYFAGGPVVLIRAEDERVLLGFWRGKRLRELEPRLVAGGKYELANIVFSEGDTITPKRVKQLVAAAIGLNRDLGDPTAVGGPTEMPADDVAKR